MRAIKHASYEVRSQSGLLCFGKSFIPHLVRNYLVWANTFLGQPAKRLEMSVNEVEISSDAREDSNTFFTQHALRQVEISPPYPPVVVARDSDGIITIPCFQPFDPSQPYTI